MKPPLHTPEASHLPGAQLPAAAGAGSHRRRHMSPAQVKAGAHAIRVEDECPRLDEVERERADSRKRHAEHAALRDEVLMPLAHEKTCFDIADSGND